MFTRSAVTLARGGVDDLWASLHRAAVLATGIGGVVPAGASASVALDGSFSAVIAKPRPYGPLCFQSWSLLRGEDVMPTRREFIQWTAATGAGLAVGGGLLAGRARAAPAASAAGGLTPYLDPMPILADNAIDATGQGATVNLTAALITSQVHSQLPPTTLFGYLGGPHDGTSYLGPVIVAMSGTSVAASYKNELAADDYLKVFTNGGSSYAQFNPFHPAETRILTHLHGGLLAGADDGNPYEQPFAIPSGQTQTATYPNAGVNSDGTPYLHPASLLWYHDHLIGDTRMNVVAGLAGAYLLRDSFDTGTNPLLPGPVGVYELPLVVQDRQFNSDGSLLYPVAPASTHGPWVGEYFGDAMLVNGKIWPTLAVEPAVYRFHVLNGCNARILSLRFVRSNDQAVPTYIIGAEGGLLPAGTPVATNRLVMGPAERFDVICDFRGLAGKTLYIRNNNPPKPVSTPAPALANVMRITVTLPLSGSAGTVPGAGSLQDPLVVTAVTDLTRLGPPLLSGGTVTPRVITLNEVGADTPAWELNLNAIPYGAGETGETPVAQKLTWNNVEDWYFVNTTADTHPMHTHLFTFTVMGRYNLDVNGLVAKYGTANGVPQLTDVTMQLKPFLTSGLMAPPPEETGLKDTVKTNPGQVTVVRARFTPPTTAFAGGQLTTQKYVHHCHIVEHEDNDMMERVIVSI
jgi:spore coat protein A